VSKRAKYFLIFAVVAVLTVVALEFFSTREPVYQGKPIGAWAEQFNDGNVAERTAASAALHAVGARAVPFLARKAGAPNSTWRERLSMMASSFGLSPRFLRASRDLRAVAAAALGEIGPVASPAISSLERVRQEGDYVLSNAAETALIKIRARPITHLLQALSETNDVRNWTRTAALVAELGPLAEPAMPRLIAGLHDSNTEIRAAAARALGRLGNPAAIPELIKVLPDKESSVCESALAALGKFQSAAYAARPAIVRLLDDSYGFVRFGAVAALQEITPRDQVDAVLPVIRKMVEDESPYVSRRAAQVVKIWEARAKTGTAPGRSENN
jgi:HEAT repeat protein